MYLFTGRLAKLTMMSCVFIFISSDPSLIPSHVIPVFQALTGDWKEIGDWGAIGVFPISLIVVPDARARLFHERFSVPDQRTEAGRYYTLSSLSQLEGVISLSQ